MGGGRSTESRLKRCLYFFFLAILIVGSLDSCDRVYTARGVYHRVRSGESLASIARSYGSTAQDIAEINNIEEPFLVKPGQRLYVPYAKRRRQASAKSSRESVSGTTDAENTDKV